MGLIEFNLVGVFVLVLQCNYFDLGCLEFIGKSRVNVCFTGRQVG